MEIPPKTLVRLRSRRVVSRIRLLRHRWYARYFPNIPSLVKVCPAHHSIYLKGLYTYQLSQRSPATWTGIDRIIVAMTSLLYLGSSAWYYKNGDGATGTLVAVAGAVQGSILTS